jgi:hypothetical protein
MHTHAAPTCTLGLLRVAASKAGMLLWAVRRPAGMASCDHQLKMQLQHECPSCALVQDPSKFTGSEVRDRHPDAPPLALAVAFKGASWTDPDSIPLMVMQTMLGERCCQQGVSC